VDYDDGTFVIIDGNRAMAVSATGARATVHASDVMVYPLFLVTPTTSFLEQFEPSVQNRTRTSITIRLRPRTPEAGFQYIDIDITNRGWIVTAIDYVKTPTESIQFEIENRRGVDHFDPSLFRY
jgi:outer membrane lipoprotein-sorting protein